MHDLSIDQPVIYQDTTSKKWYPAIITKWCDEPRSYIITTEDGAQYRKTQKHLKLYQPRPQMAVSLNTYNHDKYMQLRSKDRLKSPMRYWIKKQWLEEKKSSPKNIFVAKNNYLTWHLNKRNQVSDEYSVSVFSLYFRPYIYIYK